MSSKTIGTCKFHQAAPEQAMPTTLEELLHYSERQASFDTHVADCECNAKTQLGIFVCSFVCGVSLCFTVPGVTLPLPSITQDASRCEKGWGNAKSCRPSRSEWRCSGGPESAKRGSDAASGIGLGPPADFPWQKCAARSPVAGTHDRQRGTLRCLAKEGAMMYIYTALPPSLMGERFLGSFPVADVTACVNFRRVSLCLGCYRRSHSILVLQSQFCCLL